VIISDSPSLSGARRLLSFLDVFHQADVGGEPIGQDVTHQIRPGQFSDLVGPSADNIVHIGRAAHAG
jgi:hypothetical protein